MIKDFKYKVVRDTISKDVLDFMYRYFLLKKRVFRTCLKEKIIPPYLEHLFGAYDDEQVPDSEYAMYADVVSETLLNILRRPIQQEVDMGRIIENYSYVRIYKRGNELKKHVDRQACSLSVTLPIGGQPWPIFIDGEQIELNIGDMLIYNGNIPHWREPFEEAECVQVFLHYDTVDNLRKNNKKAYDNRLHIGLPRMYETRSKK